jgi:hypothetical protein
MPKGSMCGNISLLTKDKAKKRSRQVIKKRKKVMYILLGYLHSGIQMVPEKEEESLHVQVILNFQSISKRCLGTPGTRNPLFDFRVFEEIDIYDELENFSNLDIAVLNNVSFGNIFLNNFNVKKPRTGIFSSSSSEFLGSASLNAKEINKIKNIEEFDLNPLTIEISNRGHSQGKLLLSLCLLKTINKNNQNLYEKFENICRLDYAKFKLQMSCLGLRDLAQELTEPVVLFSIRSIKFKHMFRLEDCEEGETQTKKKKKINKLLRETSNGRNVNIMKTSEHIVSLPVNRFLWPFLDIQIFESVDSTPKFFCSIPLVKFAEDMQKEDKNFYLKSIGSVNRRSQVAG